jgi:hypothetical protein
MIDVHDDIQNDSLLNIKRNLLWRLRKNGRNVDRLIRPCPLDVASTFPESFGSGEFRDLPPCCRDVVDELLTKV